jgi:hypothetical protein
LIFALVPSASGLSSPLSSFLRFFDPETPVEGRLTSVFEAFVSLGPFVVDKPLGLAEAFEFDGWPIELVSL